MNLFGRNLRRFSILLGGDRNATFSSSLIDVDFRYLFMYGNLTPRCVSVRNPDTRVYVLVSRLYFISSMGSSAMDPWKGKGMWEDDWDRGWGWSDGETSRPWGGAWDGGSWGEEWTWPDYGYDGGGINWLPGEGGTTGVEWDWKITEDPSKSVVGTCGRCGKKPCHSAEKCKFHRGKGSRKLLCKDVESTLCSMSSKSSQSTPVFSARLQSVRPKQRSEDFEVPRRSSEVLFCHGHPMELCDITVNKSEHENLSALMDLTVADLDIKRSLDRAL